MTETVTELLAGLVGFATVAGTPNRELIDWAAERLAAAGADVAISPAHRPDGHNLHAVIGPAEAPGLVLSAHTDVVAVEGQPWSSDPFIARAADGRVYGRGTADMKGFIAAVLAALPAAGSGRGAVAPRRPVHVILSCDEELGCRGIRPLLPELRERIAPGSLTLVGEPTRLRVVERHKGKLALRAEVTGVAGHSARPTEGVNAVQYAARFIVALQDLAAELSAEPPVDGFAVPHTTLSTGPIAGGTSLNIIPDHCRVEFEARLVPGADAAELRTRIESIAQRLSGEMRERDDAAGIALTPLAEYPALSGGGDPPVVGHVAELAGTEAGGAADYGTEAGLLHEALGGTVVVCGPGDMAQAHRPDEYVERDQLERGQRLIEALLSDLRERPPA